eukprot:gene8751-1134_t
MDRKRIVRALYTFEQETENCLNFEAGQLFHVIHEAEKWLYCEADGLQGWIPRCYVENTENLSDWQNDEYFSQYATIGLHHEMLRDIPRNTAFQKGIDYASARSIRGKVVMDVGCGSGLLSMMAAKAGASQVYAIEASDFFKCAEQIVSANGLNSQIEIIHGHIEDEFLLDKIGEVDCIISEWMGTMLIFEYMIDSVITARERFLCKGGLMLPSFGKLYLAPVTAQRCGFDMSTLIQQSKTTKFSRPIHDWEMDTSSQLSAEQDIFSADLHTVCKQDLEHIEKTLMFDIQSPGICHGFGSWFNVEFWEGRDACDFPIILSTGPSSERTHWKQTLLMLDDPISLDEKTIMSVHVVLQRNRIHRRHMHILMNITYKNIKLETVREC